MGVVLALALAETLALRVKVSVVAPEAEGHWVAEALTDPEGELAKEMEGGSVREGLGEFERTVAVGLEALGEPVEEWEVEGQGVGEKVLEMVGGMKDSSGVTVGVGERECTVAVGKGEEEREGELVGDTEGEGERRVCVGGTVGVTLVVVKGEAEGEGLKEGERERDTEHERVAASVGLRRLEGD